MLQRSARIKTCVKPWHNNQFKPKNNKSWELLKEISTNWTNSFINHGLTSTVKLSKTKPKLKGLGWRSHWSGSLLVDSWSDSPLRLSVISLVFCIQLTVCWASMGLDWVFLFSEKMGIGQSRFLTVIQYCFYPFYCVVSVFLFVFEFLFYIFPIFCIYFLFFFFFFSLFPFFPFFPFLSTFTVRQTVPLGINQSNRIQLKIRRH